MDLEIGMHMAVLQDFTLDPLIERSLSNLLISMTEDLVFLSL